MNKFHITKKGYEKIKEEIKTLKYRERPNIIEEIKKAREFGDLSENAEYHAAKEKQGLIETKIRELEDKVARSDVIDITKLKGPGIKFGATVDIVDCSNDKETTYIIAGQYEANMEKNIISISSPLAKSLIGKSEGDEIEVRTPSGIKQYEVLKVDYRDFDV